MTYTHLKLFEEFRGLDLRSSEESRPRGFSRKFENMMHRPQGGMSQRYGTQIRTKLDNIGCLGIWPFVATDMLQGSADEILAAGSDTLANNHFLYRRVTRTATFTNSHGSQAATVSMYYDSATTQFRFKIIRGGSTILDQAIGDGISSAYTLGSLITAVNAVASCNLAASGATTDQACFLDIISDSSVAAGGGTLAITYYTWSAVNRPFVRWPVQGVSTADDTLTLAITITEGGTSRLYPQPFKNGDTLYFLLAPGGTIPAGITAGATYYVINANLSTIQVSTTLGGSAVNITTSGSVGTRTVHVVSPFANPNATFQNFAREIGQTNFRPCSSVPLRNVRYFSPGKTTPGTGGNSQPYYETAGISKYDGQTFYRAGLPIGPSAASGSSLASTTLPDVRGNILRQDMTSAGNYYRFQYKFIDKAGNLIEGELSPEYQLGVTHAASNFRGITFSTYNKWIPAIRGHQANYGCVNGTTTGLTFAMTDGFGNTDSSIRAGDIAYFWDNRQGRFIQRKVTAGSVSSMTIDSVSLDTDPTSPTFDDGQSPQILDGAGVSANLRVVVWRSITTDANATKYLVYELPWCPGFDIFYDDKNDADLGPALIEPAYPASPLPQGRYLATFNDQLIITGDDRNDRTVYFEDIETPEGSPRGTHEFLIPRKVTGARQSGPVLICGTNTSIHEVAGDLSEFKFKVDQIGFNVGVVSHASMQELEEGILAFESKTGPYVLYGGRRLEPLGAVKMPDGRLASRLEPYFTADYSSASAIPKFERATSVILPNERWYVLFIPLETTTTFSAQSQTLGSGSLAFVFDYGRGAWYRWLGIDFSNVCEKDGDLHFCMRKFDGSGSADYRDVLGYYGMMLKTKGKYNYCDHATPTVWQFQPHWESLGRPTILKKALRCRILSTETRDASSCTFDVNSYINLQPTLQSTDDTLTFTTQTELTPKLKSEKIKSIMMEFTGSRPYEPVPIAGYELEMAAPFAEALKE